MEMPITISVMDKPTLEKQKNKQHEIFTFIFTDEDYEYAVQHTNKAD